MISQTYRKGAIGALQDEYERAVNELKDKISGIDQESFITIVDKETKDLNCVSIQSILNHVVRAGYTYANFIRKEFSEEWVERKENYGLHNPEIACRELDKMMEYTSGTLSGKTAISLDEMAKHIMVTHWGQNYDFEQMLEHAIVHVLRHRRQIEMFRLRIQDAGLVKAKS